MRKILVIMMAVMLAFVIALGDQFIKLQFGDLPIRLADIKSVFGFGDSGDIKLPKRPSVPEVSVMEPEPESDLSYEERIKKGDYYFDRGFYTYAGNEYIKASILSPGRKEPYFKLSLSSFEMTDYSRAETNLLKVLEIDPSYYDAKFLLLLTYIKLNDFIQARSMIDQLVLLGHTDSRLMYYKALLDITEGDYGEGKKLLSQIIKDPLLPASLKKNSETVLDAYEEFDFAQAAEQLYLSELLARSLNEIEEFELAVYKLKEILRTRNDLRDSWNLLGFAYLNLGKYLFSLSSFERAYEIDPEYSATQYFLGIVNFELEKFDNAIVYLNYALKNGFEPEVLVKQKLADAYLEAGRYSESVKVYEDVLALNKEDVNAFVRPVWLYLDYLNQPMKAYKLGELAVMVFPDKAMSYNLLGWAQTGVGNTVEAEKNLKKAISIDSKFAAANYNLGKLYEDSNRNDLAMEYYQKAYELDTTGSIGNLAAKRYNYLISTQ